MFRRYPVTDRHPDLVRSSLDIWALGAVFSEALYWTWRGREGPQEYKERRRKEIKKSDAELCAAGHGTCFHNGEVRLSVISEVHAEILRHRLMGVDNHISTDISELILESMLQAKPNYRLAAMQVFRRFEIRQTERKQGGLITIDPQRSTVTERSGLSAAHRVQVRASGDQSPEAWASNDGQATAGERSRQQVTTLVDLLLMKYRRPSRMVLRSTPAITAVREISDVNDALNRIKGMHKVKFPSAAKPRTGHLVRFQMRPSFADNGTGSYSSLTTVYQTSPTRETS